MRSAKWFYFALRILASPSAARDCEISRMRSGQCARKRSAKLWCEVRNNGSATTERRCAKCATTEVQQRNGANNNTAIATVCGHSGSSDNFEICIRHWPLYIDVRVLGFRMTYIGRFGLWHLLQRSTSGHNYVWQQSKANLRYLVISGWMENLIFFDF